MIIINSIYKITNKANNKVYIGKTSRSIEQRFKEHIEQALYGKDTMLIYRAIRKYGPDNFEIEPIEKDISDEQVDNREQYWINYYRSYIYFSDCNGYNLTLGGEGCRKIPYESEELISRYYETGNQSLVAQEFGISQSRANRLLKPYKDNISNGVKTGKGTKIAKVNDSEEILETFSSLREANISMNKTVDNGNIRACLKGNTKQAYGYKWIYL